MNKVKEFDKMEYEQAYSILQTFIQQYYVLTTVLFVINATIIGFSIEVSINLLFLGTILQIIVIISNYRACSLIQPLVYQLLRIGKENKNEISLIKTIFLKTNSKKMINKMEELIDLDDKSKIEKFFTESNYKTGVMSGWAMIIVIFLMISQTLIPILFHLYEKCNWW